MFVAQKRQHKGEDTYTLFNKWNSVNSPDERLGDDVGSNYDVGTIDVLVQKNTKKQKFDLYMHLKAILRKHVKSVVMRTPQTT